MPGRSSTVFNANLKLLPSSDSKAKIFETYKASFTDGMPQKPVSSRVFTNIWKQICPEIVVMKPRSDLCAFCQKHFTSGAAMALVPEETKMETIENMRSHLQLVAKERKFYQETIKNTKANFEGDDKTCVHYSFDMAQQVHIPSNPSQPGPIYFLVPFRIGIFGVMYETVKRQVNYLIPESVSTTKGSNLIVSLFHNIWKTIVMEKTTFIHSDNCVGQNKNNILLGYLVWRICNNKNKKIVLSFMPVGHTKLSNDWAFGLLKETFRVTYVSSIQDFADCVEKSTPTTHVNSAVAVGNEKGEVAVNVYNWLNFLKDNNAKKVPHITQCNHFEFNVSYKGKVHCKMDIDGNDFVHRIFPTDSGPIGFPDVVTPAGMARQRKEYLFNNIRTFCKEEYKDLLCPEVETEPVAEASANGDPEPERDQPDPAEATKKRRKCSV